MAMRWEGDDRGHGVGDGSALVPGATELVAAFGLPGWVAEDPALHLAPHVESWCRQDARLVLTGSRVDEANAYVIEREWRGESAGVGQARAAVFALIGSFAESATYVRQRRLTPDTEPGPTLRFEVGTGELAPDTRFASHGHSVVIDVVGAH
jgi:hypothetical protein